MSDTNNEKPDPLASQGASKTDLNPGQTFEGAPKPPPEPGNEPPAKKDKPHIQEEPDEDNPPAKKDEPKKEEPAKEDDKKAPTGQFIKIGDPAADAAIEVLKESGVTPKEAQEFFAKAMQSGNLADIDWSTIEAKLGSAKTYLVKTGVETYYNNQNAAVQATVKQTHDIFGGEQNWNTVKTWAQTKESADPAFKKQVDAIRGLLNEGGNRAEIGARELLRLYNTDGGTKGLAATKLATGTSTGNVVGTPLTRAEYVSELKAAHERGSKPHEIAIIDQRRKAGMAAGI
jgi:hypothetical protein